MITLIRYAAVGDVCIFGMLIADDHVFSTLELPWRNNERNRSCIPAGEYDCDYMRRSASGKYRGCFYVKGVAGRSQILIHNGNLPAHTKGCIIIGRRTGTLAGLPAVLNSVSALRELGATAEHHNKLRVISWIG